jgi:glycosyltransferase involved in cell wall biosynthesis
MKFSIVIPSYLGQYRNAAQNRDEKILRAVNSVLTQSCQDFEVIVIADGCQKTVDIVKDIADERVNVYYIEKSKTWSGEPRNSGIEVAKSDFILYLDVDDLYGENHLQNISNQLGNFDWVWFDDIRYSPKSKEWYVNKCDIRQMGKHGTSNICHKRVLPYKWDHTGYAHDYYFIKHLRQNTNFARIEGGEYYVCHIPDSTLGKGYDL